MEFIFYMQTNIKVSTKGIIVFDGSDQICSKYQKKEVGSIFAKKIKSVAAAFMFHCDAKYLDILWRSSHVYCYLFPCTAWL